MPLSVQSKFEATTNPKITPANSVTVAKSQILLFVIMRTALLL
jgi:hypothetical protein